VAAGRGDEASKPAAGDEDGERIVARHRATAARRLPRRAPPRALVLLADEHAAKLPSVGGRLLKAVADPMRALVGLGLAHGRVRPREDLLHVIRHVHLVRGVAVALREPRELRQVLLELPQQLRRADRGGLLTDDHRRRGAAIGAQRRL